MRTIPRSRSSSVSFERYGGGFPVYIVWRCGSDQPCGTALDGASIRMAQAVEDRLRSAPGVRDVRSPASASIAVPTPGGFAVRRFSEQGELAPDAPRLAARVLQDAMWVGTLVSEDGRVGAIFGSDPLVADTDGATFSDAVEVAQGTDPNASDDLPLPDGDVSPLGAPDGRVDVGDALVALRVASGELPVPPGAQLVFDRHADVAPLLGGSPSPDGSFDAGDALVILRRAGGEAIW